MNEQTAYIKDVNNQRPSDQPIIRVENLSYAYPVEDENQTPKQALKDINLTVNPGEFVGIIGHNGSGKSTLSKILNGIIVPDSGDAWIEGMNTKDAEKIWDIRKTAGMVFQNPDNQLVSSVVETDVAFGMENLGVPSDQIKEKVTEVLEMVGMSDYRKARPHQLSGWQKQRIAIAGILAMNPDCIIFDEPTAMLDPNGRAEVMKTILDLNRSHGMTVLHITHYMSELVDADRIVVMDSGRIVAVGTPRQIFSKVAMLKQIGLDVPQMTELAYLLREDGYDLPQDILTIREMVEALCH